MSYLIVRTMTFKYVSIFSFGFIGPSIMHKFSQDIITGVGATLIDFPQETSTEEPPSKAYLVSHLEYKG